MDDEKTMTGGSMYHDNGFAGLPPANHPQAGLLNKEQNVAPGRITEVSDVADDTVCFSPSGIPGPLFFK